VATRLISLLRLQPGQSQWTALPLPTTTVDGHTYGLDPLGQGNFSMVIDPENVDVVFVGGDTQPGGDAPASNSHATGFSGRLFRGDLSHATDPWEEIVYDGANGTTPHSDSRDMVFVTDPRTGHRWILEVDDGGIYRLDNVGDRESRLWDSIGTGIGDTEMYSVAWDPLNHVIVAGFQDNGV